VTLLVRPRVKSLRHFPFLTKIWRPPTRIALTSSLVSRINKRLGLAVILSAFNSVSHFYSYFFCASCTQLRSKAKAVALVVF